MAEGWVCPKCQRVYAPSWLECQRCNNAERQPYQAIDAAEVIIEICKRRGISRAKLCEAVNTKTSTLQRLMSGSTKSLNLTTYNKIIAWDNAQG